MSDRLGIVSDRMFMIQGDSDLVPAGLTGGSRSVTVGGVALAKASEEIIEKGRRVAGQVMEAADADIEYADGRFRITGTDRTMSLIEVAKAALASANLPANEEPGLDTRARQAPEAATYPNGCHVCEVEVDPETGKVEILRYTCLLYTSPSPRDRG